MTDKTGEAVDLAHLAATSLGYTNWNIIPDEWTGWAGDLASAMANIQRTMNWNPTADLSQVARALVGQNDNYRQHPGLKGLTLDKKNDEGNWESVGNSCNRDDLCCDGDAILIGQTLENGADNNPHLLSQTLREYYNNPILMSGRFRRIAESIGAKNKNDAAQKFHTIMTNLPGGIIRPVLSGNVPEEIIEAACGELAAFIY
ncbi:hypothetical protein [Mobiluncus mulieris]|uniref:hypothetical protein n=1 Tax=Mobiluncus mulieris TaxID=2052 RepID=UPI002016694F|nr:hypothetical protein [Mobiluncus mulieris]